MSISHKMNLLNQYTFFVKLMQSVSFFDISSLRISQGSHNKYSVISLECKIWERRVSRFRPKQWNSGFCILTKVWKVKKKQFHSPTPVRGSKTYQKMWHLHVLNIYFKKLKQPSKKMLVNLIPHSPTIFVLGEIAHFLK